jgi:protein TonB
MGVIRTYRTPAFGVSLACHLACFAALVLLMHQSAHAPASTPAEADREMPRMVWLNDPGRGGGGGGGGNGMKEPPRPAERQGRDAMTVPAAKPPAQDFSKPATVEPPEVPPLAIPVAALASAIDALPQVGAVGAPPSPTLSQGPGSGGGAGTGKDGGDGPGTGPGLGVGYNGGIGGGPREPGNGVTMPIEIRKGIPRYTTEAMRARIQGSILIECVVQPEGVCTNIRVKRSFTPAFGLDAQAVKAASEWRFRPGTFRGQAVPVIVTMEIVFVLR